jgi:hypothetical protein
MWYPGRGPNVAEFASPDAILKAMERTKSEFALVGGFHLEVRHHSAS